MMDQQQIKRKWRLSRRQFLIGAGVLGGGVALGYVFGWPKVQLEAAELLDSGMGGRPSDITTEPTLWIEISPENQVTFFIPKIEMGQGVHTALAQILAEELGVDWQAVRVVQADTLRGPLDSSGTTGSTSVSSMWPVLREVAANMREMLRAEAARQLSVPLANLQIESGAFMITATSTRLTFGEVVKHKPGPWEMPQATPTLKPVSEFTLVGQSLPRTDLPGKVTGEAIYGYDARLPGMLYGAVAQPPTLGARLRQVGPGTAESQSGVVKVVIDNDFAGIVAETRQLAQGALSALDLLWDEGELWNQSDIEARLEINPSQGIAIQAEGDGAAGLTSQAIEARYHSPFAAHAHLEPQAALADVQPDKTRVWVSTQLPALTRTAVAKALGLKEE